jgi:hypothetical protein
MAAAAAVVDPGLEAAFQATCQAVARLSVAILDEKQPERDLGTAGVKLSDIYHAIMLDAIATNPVYKAELEFSGALTAVAVDKARLIVLTTTQDPAHIRSH